MQTTTHLDGETWTKSTFSSANGQCVEVATMSTVVGVRDSKALHCGHLSIPPASWAGFLAAIK
jgi:hypothetical protein